MKDKKNMTPVPAQASENEMKDARELVDEELEGVTGGQDVYGLGQSIEEPDDKHSGSRLGSVPIIRPY